MLIIIVLFVIDSNDLVFAQEQNIEDFLEWPSGTNYNFVFISIMIMIGIAIVSNYFWSKRKGRKYSEE